MMGIQTINTDNTNYDNDIVYIGNDVDKARKQKKERQF